MTELTIHEAGPGFGTIIEGYEPAMLGAPEIVQALQDQFDARGVVVLRGAELSYAEQVALCAVLIRASEDTVDAVPDEGWYVSNVRPNAAVPFGRLQFHMDTAWAHVPNEIVSLYATELEPPVAPTMFASTVRGYSTLPADLRERVAEREIINSAGQIRRRGDVSDVLFAPVERPPWTRKPMVVTHPRTGVPLLYVCEQNTKEVVDMEPEDGEALLDALFDHLYQPANVWHHDWELYDLACWDNLAIQHARPNVPADGPARTLRKVAMPMPSLEQDELPTYTSAS